MLVTRCPSRCGVLIFWRLAVDFDEVAEII